MEQGIVLCHFVATALAKQTYSTVSKVALAAHNTQGPLALLLDCWDAPAAHFPTTAYGERQPCSPHIRLHCGSTHEMLMCSHTTHDRN